MGPRRCRTGPSGAAILQGCGTCEPRFLRCEEPAAANILPLTSWNVPLRSNGSRATAIPPRVLYSGPSEQSTHSGYQTDY